MRRSALIGLFLAGTFGIPAANADILYDINFSGGSTLPTAGSFTYDAVTSTFSGFSITFDTVDFDLTSSANSPGTFGAGFPACIGALTGGAATFAMLSGECDGAASESTSWSGEVMPGSFASFQFLTVDNVPIGFDFPQLFISANGDATDVQGQYSVSGNGTWTIVVATPEPSTAMWTTGLVALGIAIRKRVASQRRSA